MLLTFTNIGSKVFPAATKAALDMAVAMAGGNVEAVDLKASSIQLGKALNDPVKGITALSKVGVSFNAVQKSAIVANSKLNKKENEHYTNLLKTNKKEAERYKAGVLANKLLKSQGIIIAEINKEFGKAGEAAGKGPEAVMRRLADAGENVSQILARATLPVLERLGKFLTDKLNDKGFLDAVDKFGIALGDAGGKFLDFLEKFDPTALINALKAGAGFAQGIIDAFLKAPTWLQEAIVTGWGLNKLTGGAVTGIFGEIASGLIKGVLGMTAGVVHINAGTVIGGGGIGVGDVPGAVAGGAALTGGVTIAAISAVAAASLLSAFAFSQTAHGPKAGPGAFTPTVGTAFAPPTVNVKGFSGIDWKTIASNLGQKNPSGGPLRDANDDPAKPIVRSVAQVSNDVGDLKGKIADDLMTTRDSLSTAAGKTTTAATNAGTYVGRTVQAGASTVAAAVRAAVPTVITNVSVSATTVVKTNTVINRYGSSGGDRNGQASRQTPI
jgi:hypothetical protein